jgi:hypothetical protein
MENSKAKRNFSRFVIICVAVLALAALSAARTLSGSIKIVNNSSREIRNVYLSHTNIDDWGEDKLGDAVIAPGQSYTISNVTWDQSQMKVVGEDQDGCFLSTVLASDGNVSWTITNDTPADCGGN